MKRVGISLVLILCLAAQNELKAQSDVKLSVYGYAQNIFESNHNYDRTVNTFAPPVDTVTTDEMEQSYNSFIAQQLNIFLDGRLGNGFTSLVNLEFVNSFDSRQNTGQIAVREMWVNYRMNDKLNIRAGLLLPRFNRLNEINNRTPLFPYINRPVIYETSYMEPFIADDLLPRTGFFQVFGTIPMGNLDFEYSSFLGNNESSFLSKSLSVNETDVTSLSRDTLNAIAVGGRLGLQYFDFDIGTIRVGVSGSYDQNNLTQEGHLPDVNPDEFFLRPDLGAIPRFRIGFDLSYESEKIRFESEALWVMNQLSDDDEIQINNVLNSGLAGPYSGKYNSNFYYASLTYYLNKNLYFNGMYSYLINEQYLSADQPLQTLQATVGYHFNDRVVLKAEYGKFWQDDVEYNINYIIPNTSIISNFQSNNKNDLTSFRLALSFLF